MSWNDTIPFAEGYARLVKEGVNAKPRPEVPPSLALDEIQMAHSVFQPRTFYGNMGDSAAHVSELVGAIRASSDHMLDPILVWWSGKCWRVVDGHHRLLAYQQATKDRKHPVVIEAVPVEVFDGDLVGALKEATARNSKDKLPMSKNDKLDRAWKFVALGEQAGLSKSDIAELSKVSERSVGYMRVAYSDLSKIMTVDEFDGTAGRDFDETRLLNMSWREVKGQTNGETIKDEKWAEKMARDWARRLAKTFGKKFAKQPEIAAAALEHYSYPLVLNLCEGWRNHLDDAREAAEEMDGPGA